MSRIVRRHKPDSAYTIQSNCGACRGAGVVMTEYGEAYCGVCQTEGIHPFFTHSGDIVYRQLPASRGFADGAGMLSPAPSGRGRVIRRGR